MTPARADRSARGLAARCGRLAGWRLAGGLSGLIAGCAPLGPWAGDSGGGATGEVRISLSPGTVDFGAVSVLQEGERRMSFRVINLGDTDVQVTGHDEPLGDAVFAVDALPVLEVPAGAEVEVPVRFRPPGEGAWRADLLVRPAEEVLRLSGEGLAPSIRLGEGTFPAVVVGCGGDGEVAVYNDGHEPLSLASVVVDSAEFQVTGWSQEIAAGGEGSLQIRFLPAGSGDRGTALRVGSDDPLQPVAGMSVSGLGYEGERVEESWRFWPSNPTDILLLTDDYGDGRAAEGAAAYVAALRQRNIDYALTALSGAGACPGHPAIAGRGDTTLQGEAVFRRAFDAAGGAWDGALAGLAAEVAAESRAGGCLSGFLRPGADLEVLIVSGGPAALLAGDAEALLGLAGRVRVSAMLPDGCGDAAAYAPLVAQTDGQQEDLCQEDWGSAFARLADIPTGSQPVSYPLQQVPVTGTLEVAVEGVSWPEWSYDPQQNAVLFGAEQIPAVGAEVVIRYVSAVTCEE